MVQFIIIYLIIANHVLTDRYTPVYKLQTRKLGTTQRRGPSRDWKPSVFNGL